MSAKRNDPDGPVVDAIVLAERCRAIALQRWPVKSSCIETSFMFERAAMHLGLKSSRVVCQVAAYSPKLADLIKAGTADRKSIEQDGMWSVGLGIPQCPEDFVGREDLANNRFVGHVVCQAESYLIDPTADQMSRPERDMPLPGPVLVELCGEMKAKQVAWTETAAGVLIKYILYPDVDVPAPKSSKIIERLARGVAREFGARV
jgi:hypothetical protein